MMQTRSRLAKEIQEKESAKSEKFKEVILFGFALLSLLHVLLELVSSDYCLYSKSLLMPLLMIYSLCNGIDVLLVPALLFAWVGDIFLYWDSEMNFNIGLGSFLIMQLFYTTAFYRLPDKNNSYFALHPASTTIVIGSYVSLYLSINYIISDTASKSKMQLPILVYSLAICLMSISALNSSTKSKFVGFNLFIGTLLFIISDGLIALTKFQIIKIDKNIAQMLIMSTYCLAQGIIVHAYTHMATSVTTSKKK